jgi:hypothetical protein
MIVDEVKCPYCDRIPSDYSFINECEFEDCRETYIVLITEPPETKYYEIRKVPYFKSW